MRQLLSETWKKKQVVILRNSSNFSKVIISGFSKINSQNAKEVSKLENISPSLEPSHAFYEAIRLAPKLKRSEVIIVNSCGDSIKDKDIIKQKLGTYIR